MRVNKNSFKSYYRRHRDAFNAFYLLCVPVGFWLIFSIYPMFFGLSLGFLEWKGLSGSVKFVWFNNFAAFFKSAVWRNSLLRTIGIGMMCFTLTTVTGCLVALLLNKIKRGQGVFRMIWYIPAIVSGVAVSQIFSILMKYDGGVINNTIIRLGGEPVYWRNSTGWMIFWIALYSTWTGLGGATLIWLSALQSINPSLIEASKLDGCNRFQSFLHISLAQMRPLILFLTVNGFIAAMNIYEVVLFISGGGPLGNTEVLAYNIMRAGFWDNDFGMAGAASMVVLLITAGFSVMIFKKQVKSYSRKGGEA